MTREKMEQLVAEYFTNDQNMAFYGCALEGDPSDGDPLWDIADRFFTTRAALGLLGYMTKEKAIEVMRKRSEPAVAAGAEKPLEQG